jgi:type 1 glutamine amidotransferase
VRRQRTVIAVFALVVICTTFALASHAERGKNVPPRLLVVTEARRYRHASRADAVALLRRLASRRGYRVDVIGAAAALTPARLAGARVVVFDSTTGELHASVARRRALLRWIQRGGSFLGLHSATATYRAWPPFGRMLGGVFRRHPPAGPGRVVVEDRATPMTRALPRAFRVTDELYEFVRDPRPAVHVLLRLDTGRGGPDRPLAWCRRYGKGKVAYDALGHFPARWRQADIVRFTDGALLWLTGRAAAPAC